MALATKRAATFVDYVVSILPASWQGYWGTRFMGVLALKFDQLCEAAQAATLVSKTGSTAYFSPDALDYLGLERTLSRYPAESDGSYKSRINDAWDLWQQAGTNGGLKNIFARLGFTVVNYLTSVRDLNTANWSRFLLFFPAGTHPVTSPGPTVGSFTVGDGTTVGPIGLTGAQLSMLRSTARTFRAAHAVCTLFVFEITGLTIGRFAVGATGLVVGGSQAVFRVE